MKRVATAPPLDVVAIPDRQRAALAWRLRNVLHASDNHATKWRESAFPHMAELARLEHLRGEVLGLISELEGARRLVLVPDDGEAA